MLQKAVGLLTLAVPALAAWGEDKPKPKGRTVAVRLSFSVDEYDPSKPSKAALKCMVQNAAPVGQHVPVGLDGGYVRLQSGSLSLRKTKKDEGDVNPAWVGPGREQVVFELRLDDIFLVAGKGGGAWQWDWHRRPEPPVSPIHNYREPGFVAEAPFTVSLDLGG